MQPATSLFARTPNLETIMHDNFASLNENLSAEPLAADLQAVLRRHVEAGADPKDVAVAAFTAAAALSVDASGLEKTGQYMVNVGATLAAAGVVHLDRQQMN